MREFPGRLNATMTGGSLTVAAGPVFFVMNAGGTITLTSTALNGTSGVLLKAAADRWGTSGSNGGHAIVKASAQKLAGDVVVDAISTVTITLRGGSAWIGALDEAGSAKSASLTLDATSSWTVTANSHVGALKGLRLSGTSVTNLTGNGHTVSYDSAANSALGGKTYTRAGGGTLAPAS